MKLIKTYEFTIEYQSHIIPVKVDYKTGLRRITYKASYNLLTISAPYGVKLDYIKKSIPNLNDKFMEKLVTVPNNPINFEKGYIR